MVQIWRFRRTSFSKKLESAKNTSFQRRWSSLKTTSVKTFNHISRNKPWIIYPLTNLLLCLFVSQCTWWRIGICDFSTFDFLVKLWRCKWKICWLAHLLKNDGKKRPSNHFQSFENSFWKKLPYLVHRAIRFILRMSTNSTQHMVPFLFFSWPIMYMNAIPTWKAFLPNSSWWYLLDWNSVYWHKLKQDIFPRLDQSWTWMLHQATVIDYQMRSGKTNPPRSFISLSLHRI